jgi:predicted solute-binding protein
MPRKMLLQELKQSDYSIVRSQIQVIKSVFQEEQTTEETKQDYYKKWKILYSLKNKKLQKVIREEMDWINIDELFN